MTAVLASVAGDFKDAIDFIFNERESVSGGVQIGGPAEILELANARAKGPRYTYISGTLNGNAPAAAAGLATLRELQKPGAYERLDAIGETIRGGLRDIVERRGIPAQVVGEGPLYNIIFTGHDVVDHRSIERADRRLTAGRRSGAARRSSPGRRRASGCTSRAAWPSAAWPWPGSRAAPTG